MNNVELKPDCLAKLFHTKVKTLFSQKNRKLINLLLNQSLNRTSTSRNNIKKVRSSLRSTVYSSFSSISLEQSSLSKEQVIINQPSSACINPL